MIRRHSGSKLHRVSQWAAGVLFIAAGANHFIDPGFYIRIVPPRFPNPPLLVAISGIAEMAGGVGLLVPTLRRPAGWGLIALLIAVFPANIYMAIAPQRTPVKVPFPMWARWLRLPLQAVLIAWVWKAAGLGRAERRRENGEGHGSRLNRALTTDPLKRGRPD